ncbi:MAG: hypothetical protein ACJAU9_001237, partial [Lentimonas sp.]
RYEYEKSNHYNNNRDDNGSDIMCHDTPQE